ncbi:hypothetical protein Tco_0696303 [Tanacetum coccineum]
MEKIQNKDIIGFLWFKGIKREYAMQTPQQNGVAERKKGNGPNWLFDLDYLTDSMNYHNVSSENQANLHAGQQESKQDQVQKTKIDSGNSQIEDETDQDCFMNYHYGNSYSSTKKIFFQIRWLMRGSPSEEQIFLMILPRSYNKQYQKREANEEAEALRKNLEQETEILFEILKGLDLVDLPYGRRLSVQKWVYRIEDERGVVIEAIRIFLLLPHNMGFYSLLKNNNDVKRPFSLAQIDEKCFDEDRFRWFNGRATFFLGSISVKTAQYTIEYSGRPLVKDEDASDVASVSCSQISDYAGANRDRKSQQKVVNFWQEDITWQCKKQNIVATLQHEADMLLLKLPWASLMDSNQMSPKPNKNPFQPPITTRNLFHTDILNLQALISLTDDLSLRSNMAALESCPKHNMIANLEKTEGNVEFHEVIDFLQRSYIYSWLNKYSVDRRKYNGLELDKIYQEAKRLASPQETAWGKDFSNPLMVYNLPKIVG